MHHTLEPDPHNALRSGTCAATDRSVDVQIVGPGKKIGPHARFIDTVRGVDDRFRDGDRPAA